jgi:hypothetical protein
MECLPGRAVGIEPVSVLILQNSGIFQLAGGDFQSTPTWKVRICNSETIAEFKKRRIGGFWAATAYVCGETGLVGWRSSAGRPPLCPFSLLTGNFTGNFCKIAVSGAPETLSCGAVTALSMQIPYSAEQGIIFGGTGNFGGRTGSLSPDIAIISGRDFREQRASGRCPLYLEKPTWAGQIAMSAKCQWRTSCNSARNTVATPALVADQPIDRAEREDSCSQRQKMKSIGAR